MLVQADYLIGILNEDEQFDYDKLGNRESVNLRDGSDVEYAVDTLTNRYEHIGAPVAHWKLNETSGTTAANAVGGAAGTLINMAGNEWDTGQLNNGLDFDNTNDYVNCNTNLSISDFGGVNGKITIAAWVRPDAVNEYNVITMHFGGVHYFSAGNSITGYSGKLITMVRNVVGGVNYWPMSSGTIAPDAWSHVVFILEGGVGYKFYINGELDRSYANGNLGLYEYSTNQYLGRGFDGASYMGGMIDDVRIYDRALSEEEVKALYNAVDDDVLSAIDNIAYDDAGNLTRDERGYEYDYDYENRLIKITRSNPAVTIAEYTYDALGRRIEVYDAVADTTTRYYYNNNWQVLTETDEEGDEQRSYIYGNYIDEVLLMIEHTNDDAEYYYAHDHLFSPVALLDDGGAILERYEYDAYGKQAIWDGSFSSQRTVSLYHNPISFTGQRLDLLDNGIKPIGYFKGRYYDPITGRMITHDPVNNRNGRIGGYIDGMNLYEYVKSNPISKYDPYGLCSSDQNNVDKTKVCCVYSSYQVGRLWGKTSYGPIKYEIIDNPNSKDAMQACECYTSKKGWFLNYKAVKARYGDCGTCGPDITAQMNDLEKAIDNAWAGWDEAKRTKLCDALYDPSTRDFAWEIFELKRERHNYIKDEKSVCPSGYCEESVTVWGTCAKNEALNYWLFGKYVSLCGFSLDYAKLGAVYHRTTNQDKEGYEEGYYSEIGDWIEAGYKGNKKLSDYKGVFGHCKACTTPWTGSLEAKWLTERIKSSDIK